MDIVILFASPVLELRYPGGGVVSQSHHCPATLRTIVLSYTI